MAVVKIKQTHRATVEQTDSYEFPDDLLEALADTDENDQEQFVLDNMTEQTETESEIVDIHETIDVDVTW